MMDIGIIHCIANNKVSNIKGIVFDRDNTLLYFHKGKILWFLGSLFLSAPTMNWKSLFQFWYEEMDLNLLPKTPQDEEVFWEIFWFQICQKKFNLQQTTSERLLKITKNYHKLFSAYSDTSSTLHTLSERGYKLSILTNFELPNVSKTLESAGINPDLFEETAIINSSMMGLSKPNPKAYMVSLQRLGLAANEVAFVDDAIENVEAANNLGMVGIWLNRHKNNTPINPSYLVINKLSELLIHF